MKIFLDDTRDKPDGWLVIRDFDEFAYVLKNYAGLVTDISFDHDFGYGQPSGVEYARLTVEEYQKQEKVFPTIFIHSMNPAGAQNIANIFADVGIKIQFRS